MNNIRVTDNLRSLFPISAESLVDATVSYDQGDLLILDTTGHLLALPAAEGDLATFVGVAVETVVDGKLKRPFVTDVDASQAPSALAGPALGVVVKLVLKTGDALFPGDLVYGDPVSGTQNVQAAGTKAIGIYQGDAISSAFAGQKIDVLIGARYPGDSLNI